jgi:hypothetical protein
MKDCLLINCYMRNRMHSPIIKAMCWLLLERLYDIRHLDDLRRHDTYIPSFMTLGSNIQVISTVLPQQFLGL